MENTRRDWLKQTGLAIAGLSLLPLESFSAREIQLFEEKGDKILLRSNENPYGPSPKARAAMAEAVNKSNRYGWTQVSELIKAIAEKNNLAEDNVLPGAGSTEILDVVARFAAINKGSFVIAETTYDYWTDNAQAWGLEKISVPLTADKKHNLSAMLKAIRPDTKLIYICNPNNPTGTVCDTNELKAFVNEASKKAIVLVDEAYIDFTDFPSLSNMVTENKNLIVAKTFSKVYGLAGARVGYALTNASTIEKLGRLQSSYSGISLVSATGALASLKDKDFVKETVSLNEKVKQYTIQQLESLGMKCIPSHSNFVYFSLANYKNDFFSQLEKNNILGTRIYEEEGKWTRITIGTMQEMQKFIKAIS
jgi:histidinol-phosphate aminotransferase